MATDMYFEETITDQGGKTSLDVELGRMSAYAGCKLPDGRTGTDSIYLKVDGTLVVMDLEMARKFVDAVVKVGLYHGIE